MKNRVKVYTKNVRFPVSENLYGLFYEDINRAGDGGMYPEMLRNRSFEDSLVPDGCTTDPERRILLNRGKWPGAFNHGEGMDDWAEKVPYTPIPGWYAEGAAMELLTEDTLNPKRRAALRVAFQKGGTIRNIGYAGVPIREDDGYRALLFLRSDTVCTLTLSLEASDGRVLARADAALRAGDEWQQVDLSFTAKGSDFNGRAAFSVDAPCELIFGFTSLLPAETYKGHGLRKDLVEALKNTRPKFLRFPGGCIVEGYSEETALRFSDMIGPVWERPSRSLMWHYRTSNGFGYHEFLQLCEDLDMDAMYVCNCGMSCQVRAPEYFGEDVVDAFLQEALGALEYALGPVDSKYGAMRAAAGHPAPFRLKYMEIGNENFGPEYNARYEKFYRALKKAYPDVTYISNTHTEKDGLPTEFVDEHYYSAPEFFLESDGRFDDYDRGGPDIFLGEYAVNGGGTIASMECALAEAVFLAGVERNQDIVKLTAYAPLLQNSDYTAWQPNLIVFDNHQVYGIPSYHAISLMAANRGKVVLESETDAERRPPIYKGIPAIFAENPGLTFKNAKIDGEPVEVSRVIYGRCDERDGVYTLFPSGRRHPFAGKSDAWNGAMEKFRNARRAPGVKDSAEMMWVAFGEQDREEYTFEIDVKCGGDDSFTLSIWNSRPETNAGCNEPKDPDWNLFSVRNQIWKIEGGTGVTQVRGRYDRDMSEPPKTALPIRSSDFNTYKIVARHSGYECYLNGVLVQKKTHRLHDTVYAVATADDETIYLKLIHVGAAPKPIEVELDCDILPDVEIETLSAPLDAVNSFENKTNVAPVASVLHNGARRFGFEMAENSVNILRMKRK